MTASCDVARCSEHRVKEQLQESRDQSSKFQVEMHGQRAGRRVEVPAGKSQRSCCRELREQVAILTSEKEQNLISWTKDRWERCGSARTELKK